MGGGRQGPVKRTSAKLRSVVGSRAGRWEAGPREKNKYKVKTCCREQSWEVGGRAQGKNKCKMMKCSREHW